jgi:thioredoxin 1
MKIAQNSFLFDHAIADNSFVLVYFSGPNCSVCQAVKPKIEKLVVENLPELVLIEIKTEIQPELAARFSVFTVPVILFFVEGKEYIREVRFIDISILKQKIDAILGLYKGREAN